MKYFIIEHVKQPLLPQIFHFPSSPHSRCRKGLERLSIQALPLTNLRTNDLERLLLRRPPDRFHPANHALQRGAPLIVPQHVDLVHHEQGHVPEEVDVILPASGYRVPFLRRREDQVGRSDELQATCVFGSQVAGDLRDGQPERPEPAKIR